MGMETEKEFAEKVPEYRARLFLEYPDTHFEGGTTLEGGKV